MDLGIFANHGKKIKPVGAGSPNAGKINPKTDVNSVSQPAKCFK
jgi:hypothetical protein